MSEAKQIIPSTAAPEPLVDAHAGDRAVTPVERSAYAVTLRARTLPRRATNVALMLTLVGIAAFALGAGVALAVLSGTVDLSAGWVKDLTGTVKDLAQHFKK